MSRSRRQSPVTGATTAASEKADKQRYNRLYRRAVKQAIAQQPDADHLPHLYEYSNSWGMNKDGKIRFNPVKRPDLLRK
jgi:hypothetical protein